MYKKDYKYFGWGWSKETNIWGVGNLCGTIQFELGKFFFYIGALKPDDYNPNTDLEE